MAGSNEEKVVRELLDSIGVRINGPNPYDIQLHDNRTYRRVLSDGALGLGESYMDGWWDCQALDQLFDRVLHTNLREEVKGNWKIAWYFLQSKLINLQKISRAYQIGEEHYDTGNDLFEAMLDNRMNYTCAYWRDATNLDEAQEAKLAMVCQKIELQPGMTVLELGCGFGAFAGYAAEKYGAHVTGVTVSKEQVAYGEERYKGLPVELKLEDYRQVQGQYDRVISIGIMEHVGYKNYRTYMEVVDRTLKDDGIAFIHTIGSNESVTAANAWLTKYIFPNGMLPSIAQLGTALEGLFVMEDWHNMGQDYDKTLMTWYDNFESAWPDLQQKYGERFGRMWRYYLLSAAGGFRARDAQLWQIVMTKNGRRQPDCRII
jgi:cyclopropane-fatty-acyl-phospholipid synthase